MACIAVAAEEALTSRLLQSTVQALELFGVYLGKELGLYAAFQSGRFLTPVELAAHTGIALRYAREWLEQQAVAGFLVVEQAAAAPDERQYRLPDEHVNVLVAEDHPAHLAPLAQMVAGIGGALGHVLAAYRNGAGVPYPLFGEGFRKGQAGINRPAFTTDLVERWIPAAPEIHARLLSSPSRVADVGCGAGWSTIAIARAFPLAEVIGFDADEASVNDARRNAATQDVFARFEVREAAAIGNDEPFDLVLVLEALHDMSHPADALRSLRQALKPGGAVLVADEKVAEPPVTKNDPRSGCVCSGHLVAASEIPAAQWWVNTAQVFILGRRVHWRTASDVPRIQSHRRREPASHVYPSASSAVSKVCETRS